MSCRVSLEASPVLAVDEYVEGKERLQNLLTILAEVVTNPQPAYFYLT